MHAVPFRTRTHGCAVRAHASTRHLARPPSGGAAPSEPREPSRRLPRQRRSRRDVRVRGDVAGDVAEPHPLSRRRTGMRRRIVVTLASALAAVVLAGCGIGSGVRTISRPGPLPVLLPLDGSTAIIRVGDWLPMISADGHVYTD